jgi:hypothetical protein
MTNKNADIFTFRTAKTEPIDDTIPKDGFHSEEFLKVFTDAEIAELAPIIFGFQHLSFN